jgi:hypothetical protein
LAAKAEGDALGGASSFQVYPAPCRGSQNAPRRLIIEFRHPKKHHCRNFADHSAMPVKPTLPRFFQHRLQKFPVTKPSFPGGKILPRLFRFDIFGK